MIKKRSEEEVEDARTEKDMMSGNDKKKERKAQAEGKTQYKTTYTKKK